MKRIGIFIFILSLFFLNPVYGEEIYLKNGDRLTGKIIKEDKTSLSLQTESMGVVSVERKFVERLVRQKKAGVELREEGKTEGTWQRRISLGYNKSSGNTDVAQLSMSVLVNKKREHVDEWTLKGDLYYSSSNKQMDAQKWDALVRYAFSLGESKRWYDFYKVEAGHDSFSNIDYRLVPSIGIGYWFYDLPGMKGKAEIAGGVEHTDYKGGTADSDEAVLVPRFFFEKKLYGASRVSQDILLYPSVDGFTEYRLHSETVLKNPLNEKLSMDLSIIEDYDAEPSQAAKKSDLRIISSLTYSF